MKRISLLMLSAFAGMMAFAQDKKIDIDVNTKGSNWYASPWIWIVAAAVFILLLVALTRGGRRD